MKKSIFYLLAFLTILLFTFSTSKIVRMDMGEPVPGAEVYVELEPDDEPIVCCSGGTGGNGQYLLALPAPLMDKVAASLPSPTNKGTQQQYKLKSYFTLPASFFEKYFPSINNSEEIINAKIKFSFKVQNGKQSVSKNFEVIINKISEIQAKLAQRYGPVTISLTDPKSSDINFTLQLASPISFGSKTGKNPL